MNAYPELECDEIDSLFHLTLVLHHLNKDVEQKFKLSLVQLFVLLRLRHLPATCAHVLASAVGVHPSTLSQTLRRLARKEFVFVTEDPKDYRRKIIVLTKRGKETIDLVYRDLKGVFVCVKHAREGKNTLESSLDYLAKVRIRLRSD